MSRPDWTNYFLGLARIASHRSHDIHTQHGCVITDRSNRILGIGYNGFPKGMNDSILPTSRPDKGIAYVTGQCCNDCIMALWQEGIKKVVMAENHGTHLFDDNAQKRFVTFVTETGIEIETIKPNFSWLLDACGVINK